MHLRLMLLVILFGMVTLISGCNGAKESDEISNVAAIGIDKADEEGMIKVSYQFALPQMGGKGAAGKNTSIITNTAVSIAEARNMLNSEIALKPSISHLKVIVVGEELARKGLDNTIGPFMRYREYRGNMFVLVARGTAKSFLEANKPLFVVSMPRYYEEILSSGQSSGYFLRTSLHQFYIRLKSHSAQPYMTLVDVSPDSGEGEISTKKVPGGKIPGYKAGDLKRQGGNPVEFAGTAVFVGDKMVGTLSTTETRMLAMLLGEFPAGFMTVEDPLEPKFGVNADIRLGAKPKITVSLVEGRPVISVSIEIEGDITSISSGINYEEASYLKLLEAQFDKVLQQEMINLIKHTQELNSDVAGFGYYLRPSFQAYQEFRDYQWNEKYQQAEVTVEVKTKLRRNGLMIKTQPSG